MELLCKRQNRNHVNHYQTMGQNGQRLGPLVSVYHKRLKTVIVLHRVFDKDNRVRKQRELVASQKSPILTIQG